MKIVKRRLIICLMIFAFAYAVPARADTNYVCLQGCIYGGKTAAQCLPQCIVNLPPGAAKNIKTSTDYRCLKLCVDGGAQAATCLPQCTYQQVVTPSTSPLAATTSALAVTPSGDTLSHKPLQAPVPIGNEVLLSKDSKALTNTSTTIGNYTCINQCVQSGLQSALCEQRCND